MNQITGLISSLFVLLLHVTVATASDTAAFFDWLPAGGPARSNITLQVTHDYTPSGSRWAAGLDERQVFHVALTAPGAQWRIGVGKGGQIYSLRGPFGEAIPPQRPPLSEWNDEVWQLVAVSHLWQRHAKETGWPWFLHGSGTYRRNPTNEATFYGPIVAEHFDASQNAYSVLTWPQQPNLPTPFRSEMFFATRFRAIDALTIEVTYGVHNWGTLPADYFSLPWGGVRASRFPQRLIALPDGKFMPVTWTFSQATNWTTMADTDGWWLFAGEEPDSPALALVMGRQREPWPGALYRCRGGYAGLPGKTNKRDYFVVSGNLRDELKPHESFVCRQFYVVGTRREVEARARELAGQGLLAKQQWDKDRRPWFRVQRPGAAPVETRDPYLYATTVPAKNPLPADHPRHAACEGLSLITSYAPTGTVWQFLGFRQDETK
jgi:hypothetical protein